MSNLSDAISGADLYGGTSYSFTNDFFCNPNSAFYFNNGYLQVPAGVYFSGDFSILAWIYLKSYQIYSRILDFGNGAPYDNIIFAMAGTSSQLHGEVCIANTCKTILTAGIIELNQWYQVSFVLKGTTGFIYVNGVQQATGTLNVPKIFQRTSNYIGKSNWVDDALADAIYDAIQIYQGAMTEAQVLSYYTSSSSNSNYNSIH